MSCPIRTHLPAFLAPAFVALASLVSGVSASAENRQPLPRFEDQICPGVLGLERESAELLVGRIRANAEDLDIAQADPADCEPNIVIAVVPDSRTYLQRLAKEKPYLFDELGSSEKVELLQGEGPARTLVSTAVFSRDGMLVHRQRNLVDIPQTTMWMAHSKIYTPTRRDIVYSLVLFDNAAVREKSVVQLADYATMQALVSRPKALGATSILSLFDGAQPGPGALTPADRAYLAAMYEGLPNLPADVRMAEVEARVRAAESVQE